MDAPCVGTNIHVDCGSVESAPWAAEEYLRLGQRVKNADAFFLTHFHYDHYNGLVWLAEQNGRPRLRVQAAYYPRIPNVIKRPELRAEVMHCLVALACYEAAQPSRLLLGGKRRFVQRHFAEAMRQVGGCPRGCLGIAQGDTIRGDDGGWRILWPPREVRLDGPYGRVMQNGVEAFGAAAEVDDDLRRAYEATAEAGVPAEYDAALDNDARHVDDDYLLPDDREHGFEGDDDESSSEIGDETSEDYRVLDPDDERQNPVIKSANQALRKVADMFSLAFDSEPHALFLGDLKSREIENVVALCSRHGHGHYSLLISSHHGTRWHGSLRNLSVSSAVVSSVGGKLSDLVRPEYSQFGVRHYLTCKHGHLILSA
jgi:hypothetical protein